jgi:hypothetical protein
VKWKLPAEKKRLQNAHALPVPVKCTRPNIGTPPLDELRGAFTSRSFFSVIPGRYVGQMSDQLTSPRLWSAWRFHVPRIWNRSIEPGKNPVKRKSQNLGKFFRKRPYLVVPLREVTTGNL